MLEINKKISNEFDYKLSQDNKWKMKKVEFYSEKYDIHGIFRIIPMKFFNASHGDGVLSILYFLKRFMSYEYREYVKGISKLTFFQHFLNIFRNPFKTVKAFSNFCKLRLFIQNPIPSYINFKDSKYASIEINIASQDSELSYFNFKNSPQFHFKTNHKHLNNLKEILPDIVRFFKINSIDSLVLLAYVFYLILLLMSAVPLLYGE